MDPSFLDIMQRVYKQVEAITGLPFDTATLGAKIRIYVSDWIRVSHVWRGYWHPTDPRPIIFLNYARAYQGTKSGHNATHIHVRTLLYRSEPL